MEITKQFKKTKQLQLTIDIETIFESILATLYEKYGEFSLMISTLDVEHPMVNYLRKHGYQEQLQQRRLCRTFNE